MSPRVKSHTLSLIVQNLLKLGRTPGQGPVDFKEVNSKKSCFRAFQLAGKMGGGGGTPLGPLLGPRPPMINNILGSDYQDYADVSVLLRFIGWWCCSFYGPIK